MTALLTARGLHCSLGGRHLLTNVSLTVEGGDLVLLLGSNGAGKSTLLRMLSGILEPRRGSIFIRGESLAGGATGPRRALAYVPDALTGFEHLSPRELTDLVLALRAAPAPSDLPALRAELGLDAVWTQPLRTLSFGQRRRASILAGLASTPALLFLDEPNSGLDPAGTSDLVALLHRRRAEGGTTVLATNDADFARSLEGTVFRLKDGALTGPLAAI